MSTLMKNDETGYHRVVGSPNEIADGKPGSYRETEWLKFIYDETCNGLYCQTYPEHWQIMIWAAEDRTLYRQLMARRQRQLLNKKELRSRTLSQLQIELRFSRKPRCWGSNFVRWLGEEANERTLQVCHLFFWWRDIELMRDDQEVTGNNPILTYRTLHDPEFADEVARGEWD